MKLNGITIKRIENNKTQQELADICGVRRTLISELESEAVLLMPEQMNKLLMFYNCSINELYPQELLKRIQDTYRPAQTKTNSYPEYYNFHVRLRYDTLSKVFTEENLRKCGYRDKTQWLYAKIKEFETELSKKSKLKG